MQDLFSKTAGMAPHQVHQMLKELGGLGQIGPVVNLLTGDIDAAGKQARKLGLVMEAATVQQLGALSEQMRIVSQVLMGNLAPALITAGKFGLQFVANKKGLYHGTVKLLKGGSIQEAVAAYTLEIVELDETLAALNMPLPNAPQQVITPTTTDPQKPVARTMPQDTKSDSLVTVGNFLGGTRQVTASLLSERNKILQEQTKLWRTIAAQQ